MKHGAEYSARGCGSSLWTVLWVFLSFLCLFAVIATPYLSGHAVMMTTDSMISGGSRLGGEVLRILVPSWRDQTLLGLPAGGSGQVPVFLKIFLPGGLWNNWLYFIACLFSSCAIFQYLRRFIQTNSGMLLAGLVCAWVGSNLTLFYAGHGSKPYVIMFFICSLVATSTILTSPVFGAMIWGSCTGLMFVQQPDVATFFALFAGAYLVFSLWQVQRIKVMNWVKVLIPAAMVAFLFAAGPLLSGYKHHVKGTVQMQTENKQAKWDYVTQWSFPPDEMIAFVARGYTGWRSNEPDGPYWGRMGRSPGWEQTRQGFQNFKLENTYLGVIPIAFSLFALFSCRRSRHRAEILFWGGATVLALLLAFGKFFPLYLLFYKLPVVNNIRNPNKFLQVFQVCLAILTAYGVDSLFHQRAKAESRKSKNSRHSSLPPEKYWFFWFTLAGLGFFLIWALSLTLDQTGDVARFLTERWPQDAAQVIVQNKVKALWHASFMFAVVAIVFAIFTFPRFEKLLRYRNWIAVGLVLIVAADAVKLSKHYIKEMPRSYIEANALTDFLKKDLGHQRVALLSQQGIYGLWNTYLLPYNKVLTFNFSDMPRMAGDYKALLESGQRNPLAMWRFSAVKYLLAPVSAEKELLAANCRKVFAHNLQRGSDGGYGIVPDVNGKFAVFELLNTLPRYALFAGSEKGSDELVFGSLSDSDRVVISADSSLPELNETGQTGTVDVLSYRPGKVKLRVRSEVPVILRCAEKYDADWKATVDGEAAEVGRVDFICQGVAIPLGDHEVVLRYAPSKLFFYMQCTGYLILFASLGAVLWQRKGGCAAD